MSGAAPQAVRPSAVSRASRSAEQTITRAASGSAHHKPAAAFSISPVRTATAGYAAPARTVHPTPRHHGDSLTFLTYQLVRDA